MSRRRRPCRPSPSSSSSSPPPPSPPLHSVRWAVLVKDWAPSDEMWNAALKNAVSPEEAARLARFRFRQDGLCSLIGRLLIRKFFSQQFGCQPCQIRLARDEARKPIFVGVGDGEGDGDASGDGHQGSSSGQQKFVFNVSHDSDWVVFAAEIDNSNGLGAGVIQKRRTEGIATHPDSSTDDRQAGVVAESESESESESQSESELKHAVSPEESSQNGGTKNISQSCTLLGVDVMAIRIKGNNQDPKRFFQTLRETLTPSEWRWVLHHAAEDKQVLRFFTLWTHKESYVKAVGDGLGIELLSFGFQPQDDSAGLEGDPPLRIQFASASGAPEVVQQPDLWRFDFCMLDDLHCVTVGRFNVDPGNAPASIPFEILGAQAVLEQVLAGNSAPLEPSHL